MGQVLAAPVRLGNRVAGALVVSRPGPSGPQAPADNKDGSNRGRSAEDDLALLGQVADQVGTVLARVERMRQGEAEAVVAAETLKSLLVHLRRDRRNGAERARYAGLVARTLGLDAAESSRVEFAALVADIALSRPETGATERVRRSARRKRCRRSRPRRPASWWSESRRSSIGNSGLGSGTRKRDIDAIPRGRSRSWLRSDASRRFGSDPGSPRG